MSQNSRFKKSQLTLEQTWLNCDSVSGPFYLQKEIPGRDRHVSIYFHETKLNFRKVC